MNRTAINRTAIVTLGLVTAGLLYAGPLNPPAGPVTSTYKTLSDVEPRIAINATNTPGDATCLFKITQPGSYYLTGNILGVAGKHGIKIALCEVGGPVSIDMRGHSLQGVSGSLNGLHGDICSDSQTAWNIDSGGGSGVVTGWGGWGIYARGSGRIANLNVMSPADGCTALTGGGNGTTTIENCRFRTTGGMGILNEQATPLVIRNTVIEADGCNTTSLLSLGGPTTVSGVTVRARNSIFSGPVIEAGQYCDMTTDSGGWTAFMTGVTATSVLRANPGASQANALQVHLCHFIVAGSVFSSGIVDVARDGAEIHGLQIRADNTTSAPVGVRVAANSVSIDQGLLYISGAAIPVAVDVTGANNTFTDGNMRTTGTAIRLDGASNTVTGSRISGSSANSIIGVLIALGSTNNLITKNEFVNLGGGTAVSNLGGATNGVAPIVTPGNLNTTTNPFSNIQH